MRYGLQWTPLLAIVFVALHASGDVLPRRAILGAAVQDRDGVRVTAIRPGGPADRGGLHAGDQIVSVGGDAIGTSTQFVARVKVAPKGTPVPFRIVRGGATMTLDIVLDGPPDEHDPLVDTRYESVLIDDSLRRTIVTTPKNVTSRRPAVLIVGGIGCFSVDAASDPEDAYLRLSHDLSRAGFLVVRLEKSGVGDSGGPPCFGVDFVSEMRSYAVALHAMAGDPRIDPHRLYLFGHSIGSVIVPRLAHDTPIAGAVIADGVGRNWFEYELWNLRRQLVLGGETPAGVDAAMAGKEICMHRLLIAKEAESKIEETMPDCRTHNDYPVAAPYLQQVAALNIAEPWASFAVPLLAIYGSGDFITAQEDHERIVAIVNAAHPGSATLRLIPGMDHHFDVAGTQQQAFDIRVKEHRSGPYDRQLSAAVLDWLCAREQCEGRQAG